MLGAPVLRPARSSKVLLVKKFQTQCSGHPFGDGWVSGKPIRRRERTRVPTALAASPWPCSRQGEMNGGCLPSRRTECQVSTKVHAMRWSPRNILGPITPGSSEVRLPSTGRP